MHKIGDRYTRNIDNRFIYLLCTTDFYNVSLVNIESGRCWRTSKRVDDIGDITEEEFKEITGSDEGIRHQFVKI